MAKLDDDVDALFRLPLTEFIGARQLLAARLKKDGRAGEAEYVKTLAKPSISAWTVNQLYWEHRDAFDRLIATGQRFRKAQTSGKMADMREALDARRAALSQLSHVATTLLGNAGHNPSMETVRRITTTLEAISAYSSLSGGPTPGRLTHDIDPPGFEALAGFIPSAGQTGPKKPAPVSPSKKVAAMSQSSKFKAPNTKYQAQSSEKLSRYEESRQAKIAAAKIALQNAKKSLTAARAKADSLEAQQKKADAAAKEVEKQRREAEDRFKKASAASDDAAERARTAAAELEEATETLDTAKRTVESTTKELESLFREKP